MANTKVTTGVIKDDAVGADQLASNAVVTASITDNAVTTAKISDDAILTAKISNSAITNAKMSANSVDSDQYVDASIDTAHIRDGQITSAKLDTNISVSGELTVGSHLNMGDGDILKMGASADLQIYHHSNGNSIISETGSGDLFIQATNVQIENAGGDNMIVANSGGAVNLYYAAAEKLATTSGGIDVTGTATMDGLTVNSSEVLFDNTGGDFTFKLNTNAVGDKNEIIMGDSGTPLAKFGVGGTANDIITGSDGQDFNIGTAGGGRAINFSTDNFASVEMKLDGGNLGIGISPRAKLDIFQQTNRTSKTGTTRGVLHLQDGDTAANNELTAITFESNSNNASAIIGQSLTNNGSELFFGTSNGYASGVTNTAMTINPSGNVGIGVSPSHPLHITKEIAGYQAYFNNDNGSAQGVKVRVKANDSGNFNMLELVSASTGSDVTAMIVRDDGSIGFGTTSPSSFGGKNFEFSDTSTAQTGVRITCSAGSGEIGLDSTGVYIQSVTVGDGVTLFSSNSGAADTIALKIFSTGEARHFSHTANTLVLNTSSNAAGTNNLIRAYSDSSNTVDGNVRFVVFPSGNVQNSNNSYGQISDRSLKENIVDTTSKLDKIKQVRIRNFNFIGDDLKQIGVVAQELETVFPNLVETIDDQDMGLKKSVKYSVFVPILIKAIQELSTQVDELKDEIQELKG